MRAAFPLLLAALLGGCAGGAPFAPRAEMEACRDEAAGLRAQLAAEAAERQRLQRAAAKREDALRRQLDAMRSIERGILDREDRIRTEAR